MNAGRGFFLLMYLPLLAACGSLDYVFPESSDRINQARLNAGKYAGQSAPDRDGDGVSDWADDCRGSAENVLVYADGCEITTGVVDGLEFAPDDVELSDEAKAALDESINGFIRYPEVVLSVTSHTDNRGSAADNLALSKQRLTAVITYLVTSGIKAERIRPFAYGESRPRAPNATLDGRERNRRIEIHVIERLL